MRWANSWARVNRWRCGPVSSLSQITVRSPRCSSRPSSTIEARRISATPSAFARRARAIGGVGSIPQAARTAPTSLSTLSVLSTYRELQPILVAREGQAPDATSGELGSCEIVETKGLFWTPSELGGGRAERFALVSPKLRRGWSPDDVKDV